MKTCVSLSLSIAMVVFASSSVAYAQRARASMAGDGMKAVCVLEPIAKSGVTGTIVFEMVVVDDEVFHHFKVTVSPTLKPVIVTEMRVPTFPEVGEIVSLGLTETL